MQFLLVENILKKLSGHSLLKMFYVLQHFESIFVAICFIPSKICSLFLIGIKIHEFLIQNLITISGMSGIYDLRLEWQPCNSN